MEGLPHQRDLDVDIVADQRTIVLVGLLNHALVPRVFQQSRALTWDGERFTFIGWGARRLRLETDAVMSGVELCVASACKPLAGWTGDWRLTVEPGQELRMRTVDGGEMKPVPWVQRAAGVQLSTVSFVSPLGHPSITIETW